MDGNGKQRISDFFDYFIRARTRARARARGGEGEEVGRDSKVVRIF